MGSGRRTTLWSRAVVGPQTVFDKRTTFGGTLGSEAVRMKLAKGQLGARMTIYNPLPADAAPGQSALWFFSTRPGVKYRICSSPSFEPAANVRPDGWLVRGDESVYVYQAGSPTLLYSKAGVPTTINASAPLNYYYPEAWLWNGRGLYTYTFNEGMVGQTVYTRSQPASNTQVNAGGYNVNSIVYQEAGTQSIRQSSYVWGPDDYVNLGSEGDGRIFSFWMAGYDHPGELTSVKVRFTSYPFTSIATDAAALAGGDFDDLASAGSLVYHDTSEADYFELDFTTQLQGDADKWCHIVCPKSGFTKTGSPLWSRVTAMRLISTFGADVHDTADQNGRFCGMYFGTPPSNVLQSVGAASLKFATRSESLIVEWDGSADGEAEVACVLAAI